MARLRSAERNKEPVPTSALDQVVDELARRHAGRLATEALRRAEALKVAEAQAKGH